MKSRVARLTSIFLIFVAIQSPALAYLDGATGSIILQAAIGLIASWMVYFRLLKEKARTLFARLRGEAPAQVDGE